MAISIIMVVLCSTRPALMNTYLLISSGPAQAYVVCHTASTVVVLHTGKRGLGSRFKIIKIFKGPMTSKTKNFKGPMTSKT